MIANGMDPAKVIVMAVDDIADYESNPFPGKVFNKPSDAGDPGIDVYEVDLSFSNLYLCQREKG